MSRPRPLAAQLVVRVDDDLERRIAAAVERARARAGADVCTSAVIRALLRAALDADEARCDATHCDALQQAV